MEFRSKYIWNPHSKVLINFPRNLNWQRFSGQCFRGKGPKGGSGNNQSLDVGWKQDIFTQILCIRKRRASVPMS